MSQQQPCDGAPGGPARTPIQWQVADGWSDLLLGPDGLRLDEWLDDGRARVVKHAAHRTVYRVDLPQRAFFIKRYRSPTLVKAGGYLVRGSASRREYQHAREIERRRVPTAAAVALGETRRRGLVYENYLVTEAIPAAVALDELVLHRLPALRASQQAVIRRKLAHALAGLCAAAHDAGVFHDDLHAGNILVRFDEATACDGQPIALYLIDLPAVRFSGPLAWRRSRDSLVMLAAAWLGRATQREQWRFWRNYLRLRPRLGVVDPRRAGHDILSRAAGRARRIARSRDRRSLATNRSFFAMRCGGAAGHGVADLAPEHLVSLLSRPDRLLRANVHRPIKLTHRSLVVEAELPVGGRSVRVAFKRTRARNWIKAACGLLRRGRAVEAWYRGHALLARGIATARPIAVCEPRGFGPRWESYLATQWIEGAENLHLYLWRLAERPAGERRRRSRQCAAALGGLLGRMHAWRVSHRDLKACNLVVAERAERVDAYLIDLDGVRIGRRLSPALRCRHLARLAASLEAHPWIGRGDRLRFLSAYMNELGAPRGQWQALWRLIDFYSRPIIRRLGRHGRAVV